MRTKPCVKARYLLRVESQLMCIQIELNLFLCYVNMNYLCPFQEHDHEAEQLISTLSLNPEDDELDIGKLFTYTYTYVAKMSASICNNLL